MLVGLGGASLEFFQLPGGEFRSGKRREHLPRRWAARLRPFRFSRWDDRFLHAIVSGKIISIRQVRRLFGNGNWDEARGNWWNQF